MIMKPEILLLFAKQRKPHQKVVKKVFNLTLLNPQNFCITKNSKKKNQMFI